MTDRDKSGGGKTTPMASPRVPKPLLATPAQDKRSSVLDSSSSSRECSSVSKKRKLSSMKKDLAEHFGTKTTGPAPSGKNILSNTNTTTFSQASTRAGTMSSSGNIPSSSRVGGPSSSSSSKAPSYAPRSQLEFIPSSSVSTDGARISFPALSPPTIEPKAASTSRKRKLSSPRVDDIASSPLSADSDRKRFAASSMTPGGGVIDLTTPETNKAVGNKFAKDYPSPQRLDLADVDHVTTPNKDKQAPSSSSSRGVESAQLQQSPLQLQKSPRVFNTPNDRRGGSTTEATEVLHLTKEISVSQRKRSEVDEEEIDAPSTPRGAGELSLEKQERLLRAPMKKPLKTSSKSQNQDDDFEILEERFLGPARGSAVSSSSSAASNYSSSSVVDTTGMQRRNGNYRRSGAAGVLEGRGLRRGTKNETKSTSKKRTPPFVAALESENRFAPRRLVFEDDISDDLLDDEDAGGATGDSVERNRVVAFYQQRGSRRASAFSSSSASGAGSDTSRGGANRGVQRAVVDHIDEEYLREVDHHRAGAQVNPATLATEDGEEANDNNGGGVPPRVDADGMIRGGRGLEDHAPAVPANPSTGPAAGTSTSSSTTGLRTRSRDDEADSGELVLDDALSSAVTSNHASAGGGSGASMDTMVAQTLTSVFSSGRLPHQGGTLQGRSPHHGVRGGSTSVLHQTRTSTVNGLKSSLGGGADVVRQVSVVQRPENVLNDDLAQRLQLAAAIMIDARPQAELNDLMLRSALNAGVFYVSDRLSRESSQQEKTAFLHAFDTAAVFGPSMGIPRLTRWWRAKRLGLLPPIDIYCIVGEAPLVWETVRAAA
ncbi:unnamed protein product [Amoebophrya sp. A25]|nr:unnamed protein product [Amoebophrya sp. A25]|eukprot:GSA25T00010956001.1